MLSDKEILQVTVDALKAAGLPHEVPKAKWEEAPTGYNFWAVEPDGSASFYFQKPKPVFYYWAEEGPLAPIRNGFVLIPMGIDWRLLMEERLNVG